MSPTLVDDINVLKKSAKNARTGVSLRLKQVSKSLKNDGVRTTAKKITKAISDKVKHTINTMKESFKNRMKAMRIKKGIPDAEKPRVTDGAGNEAIIKSDEALKAELKRDSKIDIKKGTPEVEVKFNDLNKFTEDQFADPSFLKRAGLSDQSVEVQKTVKEAFGEAMKDYEKGRREFFKQHGHNFDKDTLMGAYYENNVFNLKEGLKRSLKKAGMNDLDIKKYQKNLLTFEDNTLGREWANKFSKKYLGRSTGVRSDSWRIYERWDLLRRALTPIEAAVLSRRLFGKLLGTRYVKKSGNNFIKPENDEESKRLFDAMQDIVDSKSKDEDDNRKAPVNDEEPEDEDENRRAPVNDEEPEDEDDNRRRRLLGKAGEGYDYSALWADFVEYVEVDEEQADVCKSGYDMLSQVDVDSDGYFEFRCGRSPGLCKCISAIGRGKVGDQVFFADDLELTVFRGEDGYAAYEIKEGGEYISYGDVNDGRVDRRRRLLQASRSGGS